MAVSIDFVQSASLSTALYALMLSVIFAETVYLLWLDPFH